MNDVPSGLESKLARSKASTVFGTSDTLLAVRSKRFSNDSEISRRWRFLLLALSAVDCEPVARRLKGFKKIACVDRRCLFISIPSLLRSGAQMPAHWPL
jgi:hypothetical protein